MNRKRLVSALAALCMTLQASGFIVSAAEETDLQPPATEQPAEGEKPEDPEIPADPADPVDPEDPSDPTEPDDPVDPSEPTDPSEPDDPVEPADPSHPDKPADPDDPSIPAEPEEPVEPTLPEEPSAPVQPSVPAEPSVPVLPPVPVYTLGTLSTTKDARLEIKGLGSIHLLPDFGNEAAWKGSSSAYNTPALWGQCTWFAWGRFYEIYGFDPGFTGNGNQCVDQLVAAHEDLFEKSRIPRAGAVFSGDQSHNHVGIVLAVDDRTGVMLIQEGNLDGQSNPDWHVAAKDWMTSLYTPEQMKAAYGDVVYANPKLNEKQPALNHIAFIQRSMTLEKQDFGKLDIFDFADYIGDWNGTRLDAYAGTIMGPSGKETYYNLPMNGVVSIMRNLGNTDPYWVRSDGCKMLGNFIMAAADLNVHPRGSYVQTSLGMAIVCDTGDFAAANPWQIDIAVNW